MNAERCNRYRDKLKAEKQSVELNSILSSKEHSLPTVLIEKVEKSDHCHDTNCEEVIVSECEMQTNPIQLSVNNEAQQSWFTENAVDEISAIVRRIVLDHRGILLDLLEQQFWTLCGDEQVLRRLEIGVFHSLLELSPSILVRDGRVFVSGVEEEESDMEDDSDYFVVSDEESESDANSGFSDAPEQL
ncbi:hypothetical protein ABEB36_013540 [Hypothenemus hampei]|uniref:Uncharacterized protein n=1 Tax=Hypothenemus hampei TaxID=57062 RepID=A0ABD1E4I3_HYPHA